MPPDNSPIFVVGCPRSGTTLLRNLLRAHSRITFANETQFIPRVYKKLGEPADEAAARRLVDTILEFHSLKHWECTFDVEAIVARKSYAGIVDEIYQHWLRKEGKPRWGDKTPQYVLFLPVLAKLFPDAKFIHIVRDGRDVAVSWVRASFGPGNLYRAAVVWKRFVELGMRDGAQLRADQYTEIRYEDLLGDPERTLRGLCDFLNEQFEPDMLAPNNLTLNYSRHRRLRVTKWRGGRLSGRPEIVRENADKWRTALTQDERALFEGVAGDTLKRLGYETEGLSKPVSPLQAAYFTVDSRIRETISRLNFARSGSWLQLQARIAAERLRRRLSS